ncbi:MAG: acetamidase/formamidase family protein [Solirubrobacteraceae bacterium]
MADDDVRDEVGGSEAAFHFLDEKIGRRALLQAAATIGVGAVAPAWTLAPGVAEAAKRSGPGPSGPGPSVLQSGHGPRSRTYITSTPQTVRWGSLPNRDAKPVRTVRSGANVTFDTVSHEGILEDQGRDPVRYFRSKGVAERDVLHDARVIAASGLAHDFVKDGPHIVTGPVDVIGARPGDVLRIDVVSLIPRAPYGVISNRHGKGALPDEYPQTPATQPDASAQHPERYHNVSVFTPVRKIGGRDTALLPAGRFRAEFPIDPFMGITGVALDTSDTINSIPPTVAGGNLDIRNLTVGSTLFLPVFVPGAKFFAGDPHYRQGDGEVALTALEAPLRATFKLTLLKAGSAKIPGGRGRLDAPFGETAEYWMPVGLNPDLDEAMKMAVREAIEFLHGELGMQRAVAYAYLSAASDFVVSQVVDKTKGVHARIHKADFHPRR